jgi:osmotically-inducible protein OsmY
MAQGLEMQAPGQFLPTPLQIGVAHSLVVQAQALLRASSYRSLGAIVCDYYRGALRLRGNVPSYYLKQIAQSLVLALPGVDRLHNELTVVWNSQSSCSSSTRKTMDRQCGYRPR